MTFCSKAGNLREKSFSLVSFLFLVKVVKALSNPLRAVNTAQEVVAGVVVAGTGAGLPYS